VRQAGLPSLSIADLARDRDLLDLARADAAEILSGAAGKEAPAFVARVVRRAERRRAAEGG
jgi:RecG-like helicase